MLAVLPAGRDNIDARGIDIAVPQDVGQFGDVPVYRIKAACKKVSEAVWEYFAGFYTGAGAQ